MKIPANGCQIYKKALDQLWMTFARDWLCSGFTLVCKASTTVTSLMVNMMRVGSRKVYRLVSEFVAKITVTASVLSFLKCCLLLCRGTVTESGNSLDLEPK